MSSVLESLPPESRIVVVRLRSLGDCVLATPALQLLHEYRPGLRIAVAVEDRFREVFDGHPAVERTLGPRIGDVRGFRPQLCLNFHGGTRSAWMTALSGARWRAGFAHYRHGYLYNVRIPRAQQILGVERKVHTAEHLASAMFYLGVPQRPIPRSSLPPVNAQPGKVAVIHPLAATAEKTWPASRFLDVARHLVAGGIEPVFIGSAADDLSAFASFRRISGASLRELTAILAGAALFIGNDSGPAHMAAAAGLPVVVLFGTSDPQIWGPWQTPGEAIQDPDGIGAIPSSRVIEALERLRVHV